MAHKELYLNLNYNQKLILAIIIVSIFILVQIVTKIKNKAKKCKKQQIIHKQIKMPNWAKIIANYDSFIKENTKGMTLYEVKDFIKNVDLEIYRLVMKGVR